MGEIVTYSQLGKNGRLGNQLFQIAATIAYALDTGKDFVFPRWEYSKYFLHELPQGEIATQNRYNEPHFHWAGIPHLPGNVDLFGHFQSEKYFVHHRTEIVHYFTPNKQILLHVIQNHFPNFLPYKKRCSIHVRRTDYDTPINRDFHGVLPMEYYMTAIEKLYGSDIDKILFVICSDDIAWCRENFNLPKMYFVNGENDITDMQIMKICDDNIIANSSFSWWSAWLNENVDKKVVSPQKWFNNAPHNSKDVHCENWMVI